MINRTMSFDTLVPYRTLDVSFNLLRAIPPVIATLPALRTVYFIQNKITRIEGLSAVGRTLRSLELGGNRIRVMSLYFIGRFLVSLHEYFLLGYRRAWGVGKPWGIMARQEQDSETRGDFTSRNAILRMSFQYLTLFRIFPRSRN